MYPSPTRPIPTLTEVLGWPRLLAFANVLLAVGAGILALPALDVLLSAEFANIFVASAVAIAFTAVFAWPVLFAAAAAFVRTAEEGPSPTREAALFLVLLGPVGFAVGLATLPLAFPASVESWFCAYEWQCLLFFGGFPYVPSVFAAPVLSHAALAYFAALQCRDPGARVRLRLGAASLMLVVLVSVIVQLSGAFNVWVGGLGLASLTAPGYLVAAVGLRREARARATGALSPGLGAPSRGSSP